MKDIMIGIDLAKNVFQLHATTLTGELVFRKRLRRDKFRVFMAEQPAAIVFMEACSSSHYWAREMARLGHEVSLIAPQYVRPFVKRGKKNDAADAEAIVIAALSPGMRFVEPKTADQQAKAVLFRSRDRLVHHRTELVNALRAALYEYGHVAPQGIKHLKRLEEIVNADNCDLPDLVKEECLDIIDQIMVITGRIEARTKKMKALSTQTDMARRLQTMPGVGPLTAIAVEAFAPDMNNFKRGRDFAAWLGLTPKQNSSGDKHRLGKVSKMGQVDIRRLLIIGAMSRLSWLGRKKIPQGSWLSQMLERKPRMLVAIALANKMARMIWAMIVKGEDYRAPPQSVSGSAA